MISDVKLVKIRIGEVISDLQTSQLHNFCTNNETTDVTIKTF